MLFGRHVIKTSIILAAVVALTGCSFIAGRAGTPAPEVLEEVAQSSSRQDRELVCGTSRPFMADFIWGAANVLLGGILLITSLGSETTVGDISFEAKGTGGITAVGGLSAAVGGAQLYSGFKGRQYQKLCLAATDVVGDVQQQQQSLADSFHAGRRPIPTPK